MDLIGVWISKDEAEKLLNKGHLTIPEELNVGCDNCSETIGFELQINMLSGKEDESTENTSS